MRFRTLLIVILLVILKSNIAQNSDFVDVKSIDEVKSRLTQHAKSTKSIESNFLQEKHLWMLNEVIVSKGIFLFKKDNSVRWQYNTPIEYTIAIHNGKFSILSNQKVNVFDIDSNPMFREINSMIVTAIRGDFIDNPDFDSQFLENEFQYLAKLTPVKSQVSSMLTSIEIYFDKKSMEVEKVIFNEPGDDFTSITFVDKKINTELQDERFLIQTD